MKRVGKFNCRSLFSEYPENFRKISAQYKLRENLPSCTRGRFIVVITGNILVAMAILGVDTYNEPSSDRRNDLHLFSLFPHVTVTITVITLILRPGESVNRKYLHVDSTSISAD